VVSLKGDPINDLVKQVLLEVRRARGNVPSNAMEFAGEFGLRVRVLGSGGWQPGAPAAAPQPAPAPARGQCLRFVQERSSLRTYKHEHYQLKWTTENELGLVFVLVATHAVSLLLVEQLLENTKRGAPPPPPTRSPAHVPPLHPLH